MLNKNASRNKQKQQTQDDETQLQLVSQKYSLLSQGSFLT